VFATIVIGSLSQVGVCLTQSMRNSLVVAFFLAGLSACGGGGDSALSGNTNIINNTNTGTGYAAGVYMPSGQFKGQCAAPRAGNPNDRPGTTLAENLFLRSYTNETYLWYRDVPDVNPAGYSTTNYFNVLKSPLITPSGHPKDKYHFTYPTAVWEALSQSGTEASYGVEWVSLSTAVPRRFVVAYIHPNSPAGRVWVPNDVGEVI
jgi:carboxyl-terminal processing protease